MTIQITIFQMTKRTFAVLASMMLVASLAVAGCSSSQEEITVDDIIVDTVEETTDAPAMEEAVEMTEESMEEATEESTEEAAE